MKLRTRFEIVAEARRIREDCLQIFADAKHWNENVRQIGELPIDPDPDGGISVIVKSIDAMLAREILLSEPK